MFTFSDWPLAFPHEKYVYLRLMNWVGADVPLEPIDIDTTELCGESLRYVRDNGVTIREFAENVVKIPRAHVSLYFHAPKRFERANDHLR